jgi:energy-coupling factor transporter ATP-binding protein EcfA2
MRYHQVINFEPLETVIQLLEADEKDRAADLVRSFVISHRMSENLTELVFPQLQYHQPRDNKGLFIVGNYGTGKSHLLSFISAVAQHADLVADIHDEQVAQAASSIAGKFKVLRTEIGAVTKPLRDIVLDELEAYLDSLGIKYRFPSAAEVSNNKELLVEMMAAFNQAYPQHGLLVVADELLDYLRGRKEQELVLDLGFLREVGEVCGLTRFRFVAGIQESLFDNPRFQFVASSIRRVKDRFEQVRIVRQDIAFVVANRLLRKNAKQRALIREHLQPFIKLYQHMSERLEDFVALFPIHPAYLEIFEQLYVVEQRQALKAISTRVRKLLDQEISASEPGIISFDSYWDDIQEEAALRSDPAVREVLDKSQVLENRIKQAMPVGSIYPWPCA